MSERPETETPTAAVPPGEVLRRAREGKSLSVAAIATQLNLDIRTVEALEQGDLARLPAPIFVRGYLRGYARLVGVREDEVVDAYQAQAPREPMPRAVGTASAPMRPAYRGPRIPWGALFGLLLLILLAALAYEFGPRLVANLLPQEEVGSPDVPLALPESGDAPVTAAPDERALPLPLPPPDPQPVEERTPEAPPAPEPELPSDSDFGDARAAAGLPPDSEALAPGPEGVIDPGPEIPPESDAPAQAALADGRIQLEFRFADDSWVEVRDAGNSRLIFGLVRKGDSRSVSGIAPISVLLGNARAVKLRVGGEPFDHARFIRNNVARFRVDGTS